MSLLCFGSGSDEKVRVIADDRTTGKPISNRVTVTAKRERRQPTYFLGIEAPWLRSKRKDGISRLDVLIATKIVRESVDCELVHSQQRPLWPATEMEVGALPTMVEYFLSNRHGTKLLAVLTLGSCTILGRQIITTRT